MSRFVSLLLAVISSFACSKDSSPGKSEPKTEVTSSTTSESSKLACDQRMDQLAGRLPLLAKESGIALAVPVGLTPIESSKGSPVESYGSTLVIESDGAFVFQGQQVANLDDLKDRLTVELDRILASDRGRALYIWAQASTPAASVAHLVSAVPADFDARLALVGPERPLSDHDAELLNNPRIQRLRDEIDDLDPAQKAATFAKQIQAAVGACAPLIRVFGSVASTPGTSKAEYMAKAAPEALRDCQCQVADLDTIEYALLAVMGAYERPVRSIPAIDAASVLGN